MAPEIKYRWNGTGWQPLDRHLRQCAEFVVGQIERLKIVKERSEKSHRHYFACLRETWLNLPEGYRERFGTDETEGTDRLRKWCLMKAGFRKEHAIVAMSGPQARKIAALAQSLDDCAVVMVDGNIVTVWTAKSQKMKKSGADGMDKDEFERSKEAVLNICAGMLGIDPRELSARGAAA
jgi:hypothetical protein